MLTTRIRRYHVKPWHISPTDSIFKIEVYIDGFWHQLDELQFPDMIGVRKVLVALCGQERALEIVEEYDQWRHAK